MEHWSYCYLLASLVLLSKSSSAFLQIGDVPIVDNECLMHTCGATYLTCKDYPNCVSLLTCLQDCMDGFDADKSDMKSTTHLCVNKCIYMYEDIYFVALARCLADNNCVKLPSYPSTCRYPDQTKQIRKYQLQDLKGGWWVNKGYNRAYDCLSCQRIFFDAAQFSNNEYMYRPMFYTGGQNHTLKLVNGSILVDLNEIDAGDPVELDYYLFGVPFKLTWHVLDGYYDNSIVYVYYCATLFNWNYEGALILSHSKELPSGMDQFLKNMVSESTGLDYNDFCSHSNGACTNA